jgi:hypothetical protein
MSNIFDPIDGEPLRDFLGQLQNANARSAQQRSQQATNSKLDHIAFYLHNNKQNKLDNWLCHHAHTAMGNWRELLNCAGTAGAICHG